MKILIISRGYPTREDPLNGNFEYEQAIALANQGIEVVFAYIDRRTSTQHNRAVGLTKITTKPFPVYGGYLRPIPFRYFPRLSTWLYKRRFLNLMELIVNDGNIPELIHCHYLFNLPCALAIKDKYNIPVIITEHWSKIKENPIQPYVRYLSKFYSRADKILTVSNSLAKSVKDISCCECTVLPNMVSEEYFKNNKKQEDKSKTVVNAEAIKFIAIGSFLKVKSFDLLIEAFSSYHKRHIESMLTIVGDGPEMLTLQGLVKKEHLSESVRLTGRLNKEDVRVEIMKSDVLVVSSIIETFSVVAIEAMSCGRPVISTDCGGPSDFITDANGIICKEHTSESLCEAMELMTQNIVRFDSLQIKEFVINNYHPRVITSKLKTEYKKIITNYQN